VKVDDREVKDSASLVDILSQHKPGDKLTFRMMRGSKETRLTASLGERLRRRSPLDDQSFFGVFFPWEFMGEKATAYLGVRVGGLTQEARQRLGVTVDRGALVDEVYPDTPAAKIGLKRDDVITRLNATDIGNGQKLRDAIQRAGAGTEVTLKVARGRKMMEFKVTLGPPAERITKGPRAKDNRLATDFFNGFAAALEKFQQGQKQGEKLDLAAAVVDPPAAVLKELHQIKKLEVSAAVDPSAAAVEELTQGKE
jgi:hypothetical protein